jgi:alpha-glucosidase
MEGPAWPGASIFLDFTLPAARDFWAAEIGALVGLGIDGVWLDVNEPTLLPESGGAATFPSDLPIDGDGVPTTMAEGQNVYALHQAIATVEGLRAAAPERRPFVLTRAGYAGVQRYAAMWTGDAPSTWATLAQTPAMLTSLGISGVPFVGSDIGGYSGHATPELYARWMEVGALSPFCRAHVTSGVPDQEPWALGPDVEAISRERLRERYRWLPYLYSLFAEAEETGAPPLRPMVWEYQDDPAMWRVDDQMMLGPFLVIAPVLEAGATRRRVRLPAGRFFELASGAIYDGPATIEVSVTLSAVPTFVREGAILVRREPVEHTGETPSGPLRVDVYPADRETRFTMHEDAGDGYGDRARTTLVLARTASGARLSIEREGAFEPRERDLAIHVHRVDGAVRAVRSGGVDVPFEHDARERSLLVVLGDRASIDLELEYDTTITELRPDVELVLEVEVPGGGPSDPPIRVASSADEWSTHHPLEWVGPGRARGTLRARRGEWVEYKYTRGDWDTVEKLEGCLEAPNRRAFGAAHPARRDRVATWRDACP